MVYYNNVKRKIFISFHHASDEGYKNKFERVFGHLFVNKSVQDGSINSDNSTEYIKRLIQSSDYLKDASVCVVLIGKDTLKRKHIDWEIYGALTNRVGGCSGVVGILLPTFELTSDGKYLYEDIPPRLSDNIKSGYANIYTWDYLVSSYDNFNEIIENAFNKKNTDNNLINNSLAQFTYNRN